MKKGKGMAMSNALMHNFRMPDKLSKGLLDIIPKTSSLISVGAVRAKPQNLDLKDQEQN